jgi:hypothetical protein
MGFSEHPHESRFSQLITEARAKGQEPAIPSEIEDLMSGDSFVGGCQGCRVVSHVISHRPR